MLQVVCHCGKTFQVRLNRVRHSQCCSVACRRTAPEPSKLKPYPCRGCNRSLPGTEFHWYRDPRYSSGWRRYSICNTCARDRVRVYRSTHKVEIRAQHTNWRRSHLTDQDHKSLRFWFARQLGGYRKRSRDRGLPFELTIDDLMGLYYTQDGKCYYTAQILTWGHTKLNPHSLSLDRRIPSLGYVVGNVVLCLFQINTMKGARTEADFYTRKSCSRGATRG